MQEFIKFPSIEQYRNIVKTVRDIYKEGNKLPTITFSGTVKIHGTNAGVTMSPDGEVYAQSRNNIITPEKDNAGFACFFHNSKEVFKDLLNSVVENNGKHYCTIFGEWCGEGIQKGVGVSELNKMFVIFGCKVGDKWVNHEYLSNNAAGIYNITQFKTYSVDVDFNYPEISQNIFSEITEAVEKECPVAKYFGVSGVGEGVVWTSDYNGKRLTFKVKGEKHSTSKVKTLAKVDTDKIENIQKFVDYAVTENRLTQAIEYVFTMNDIKPDIKLMGDFIRWVVSDINKEELDTMHDSGIEPKQVNKYISTVTRQWFVSYLDKTT